MQQTKPREWLVYVLNKYDIPKITMHGFRHTKCSFLLEAEESKRTSRTFGDSNNNEHLCSRY